MDIRAWLMGVKLIIEHLEEKLTRWLLLEYSHASRWWNEEVIFTNVKNGKEQLSNLGVVYSSRFYELIREEEAVIVLDPKAEKPLKTSDFKNARYVIIGGICGEEKMRGRTSKFITSIAMKKLRNIAVRNLGKVQLPIDQAAIAAKLIKDGMNLEQIEMVEGLTITLEEDKDFKRVVELPYGYVILNGKPAITPEFVEFLKEGLEL